LEFQEEELLVRINFALAGQAGPRC
jgi:hypothetical protein